jgi:hypothetical protein
MLESLVFSLQLIGRFGFTSVGTSTAERPAEETEEGRRGVQRLDK